MEAVDAAVVAEDAQVVTLAAVEVGEEVGGVGLVAAEVEEDAVVAEAAGEEDQVVAGRVEVRHYSDCIL